MRDPVRKRAFRCAIYTRKSSEEGLEQDFNSLQAQREACEAYVTSQRHEGWKALSTAYDDGAYSGGTMERPALKQLLADVGAGKVDIVVVYKVDRLTRSLMDFAKIVEIFDRQNVSFVSVTQAFNTTSSMGRLTLNVLLSFAQFEREVTGERIRDKIAASKKKGLWMGGFVPLGYRPEQRTLAIHNKEAEIVRAIFKLYCETGSVAKVEAELVHRGIRRPKSKAITSGRTYGGREFTRGEIYKLLSNPVYVGEIGHKGQRFDGQHPAIIDPKTWALARMRLATNTHARNIQLGAKDPSLLAGLLFDDTGTRLTPTHTNRQGKRYRYYAKPSSQPHGRGRPREADRGWRIPAPEIEKATVNLLVKQFTDQQWVLKTCGGSDGTIRAGRVVIAKAKDLAGRLRSESRGPLRELLLMLLARVTLSVSEVRVEIRRKDLAAVLGNVEVAHDGGITTADWQDLDAETGDGAGDQTAITVVLPIKLRRRGLETKLVLDGPGGEKPGEPDPALVKMIANAHQWWEDLVSGRFPTMRALAQAYNKDERYVARVIPLAFLAPAIVDTILTGRHPIEMTAQELITLQEVPAAWASQVSLLIGSPDI
jgi:DNA invertase Pin-like site-specific DNA recombinase